MSDIFAMAVWPMIVIGIWLSIRAKRFKGGEGRVYWLLAVVGFTLLVTPLFAIVYYSNDSSLTVANRDILVFAIGIVALWSQHRVAKLWKRGFVLALGILMVAVSGWYLFGDFVLRRQIVDGTILDSRQRCVDSGRGCHVRYDIEIGRHTYETTFAVYQTAQKGQRVRAEIGRGSGMIFAIETLSY